MSIATLAPTDLATNLDVPALVTELEIISDEFNRKLGKMTKAEFVSFLGTSFYGVDATLITMTAIDRMFEGTHAGAAQFTYGLTSRLDTEIVRLSA